jgi:hypothetical protein
MVSESKQVGFIPLPRAGGALSHAVVSIRDLKRHCQNHFATLHPDAVAVATYDVRANDSVCGK